MTAAMESTIDVAALQDVCSAHKLHYYSWGDAANPRKLLCLHGLTRNARDFDYLAEALAEYYHVIAPDMPGRGKSPSLDDALQYTYATYLHDVLSLTTALKIASLDLVGTSMGGILGMMLGNIKPDLIRRLMLNDIGAVITKEGLESIMAYIGHAGPFNTYKQAKDMLRERMASFGIEKNEHWQHIFTHNVVQAADRRYYLAYDPELITPLRNETSDFKEFEDISLWEYWENLKCPVLLLRGGDSDIFTQDTADAMCKSHAAGCKLITYPGVGHAPALMDKEQINNVKQWLLAD